MTPGKRRTREHVIADLSVNHVERVAFRCGYAVLRNTTADYGIDLLVYTCTDDGIVEEGEIKVQLKATDRLPLLADRRTISFRVDTVDVASWSNEKVPVLLVVYDAGRDRAYGLDVRAWAWARRSRPADWRTRTVQIRIPLSARLTPAALKRVRREKNRLRSLGPG